ncbi:HAMP domain-containing histidine kinase [candidate division WOR-3 bacterium]|nr:HAMP domain-containing histidine kinase [candidate division WOR-3 bacterium]
MSFRTKIIININILLFVFMMSLAAILVHMRSREMKSNMEKDALTFATLTAGPLCETYENYYESGYFKFRQLVVNLLALDTELIRVAIYTFDGKKVFDSDEFKGKGVEEITGEEKQAINERVKQISPTFSNAENQKYYDVIYPYLEPWGWHRYSVRYYFTKQFAEKRLFILRLVTFSVTIVAILLTSLISHIHTRTVMKPLMKLTDAAKEITAGNFDAEIETNRVDEIGILAKALKEMINRVKKDMDILESQKRILSEANIELERLNDLKSQFIASVSHELKTPLTSLKGYIDYLYQEKLGTLSNGQRRGLEVVKRNLQRLNNQIMNLIDFSSFESGKIELSLTPFHIQGVINEVITNLNAKFSEKEIVYEENIPSDILPVFADRERIIQVLENLITNAVKFTSPGGKISIDCHNLDRLKSRKIEVCVKDSGIGIPESTKEKIFEKFVQIDPKSKYKGLGIGLSIVKSILDAHDEKINVVSKEGEGSNFCFTLPVYGGGNK